MWWWEAERLATAACQRRPDGTTTRRSRRALTQLLTRIGRNDRHAATVLRQAWLQDPRDDNWDRIGVCCTPQQVIAAAVDPTRDAAQRVVLGAFCARHDLVPDVAEDRAVFYVLTGQAAQHRALDPDGSLLATAYHAVSEPTRSALRQGMVGSGGLDAVRVVADRTDRVLTSAEADYTAEVLAGAGEWERLWRMMPTFPLASAARAARLCPQWRPTDETRRVLFDRLAGTGPELLIALATAGVTRISTGPVRHLSFAPDNAEIAVAGESAVQTFALSGGRLIDSHDTGSCLDGGILSLGAGVNLYWGSAALASNSSLEVLSLGRSPEPELYTTCRGGIDVRRTRSGFVVDSLGGLRAGTRAGPGIERHDIDVRASGADFCRLLDADATGENLLVRLSSRDGQNHLALADGGLRVLARTAFRPWHRAVLVGPEEVVLQEVRGGPLQLRRREGSDLVPVATYDVDRMGAAEVNIHGLTVLSRQLVAVHHEHGSVWLEARTLTEVDRPPGFPAAPGRVTYSVDGSRVAVRAGGGIEVHDTALVRLAELVAQPLSAARVDDLATVAGLAQRELPSEVRAGVDVVSAGLALQFGVEVGLGSGSAAARADDIGLGARSGAGSDDVAQDGPR